MVQEKIIEAGDEKMPSATAYLLTKIINNTTNGLESLGSLNGKYIDDVAKVIQMYAEESILKAVDMINKHGSVIIGNTQIMFKKPRKKTR